MECDGEGRILAVDNDPDSSPPNRLLHVVPGGDYGYNMSYGRAGTHPFQCWDGELPGTLPMICGVGEAATDVMDMRHTSFRKPGLNVMVTSWGDSQIETYQLANKGTTLQMVHRAMLVRGNASFRPACLAAGSDGSVYVTDWADREYSVHGKGIIWKLKAKAPATLKVAEAVEPLPLQEKPANASPARQPGYAYLNDEVSRSEGPFERHAAIRKTLPALLDAKEILQIKSPVARALAVAGMRQAGREISSALLAQLLEDTDGDVVRMSMMVVTDRRITELKPNMEAALNKHSANRNVFRTGMAALELIDKGKDAKPSGTVDGMLLKIIADSAQPSGIRAMSMLSLTNREQAASLLLERLKDEDSIISSAAARALDTLKKPASAPPLRDLALNAEAPLATRLEALSALSGKPDPELLPLLPLLKSSDVALARQSMRTLRGGLANKDIRGAFSELFQTSNDLDPSVQTALALALGETPKEKRPTSDAQWLEILQAAKGDVDEGRRVFFSAAASCSTCHVAEGRGHKVGPDLSYIARASNREKLISSILTPNRDIGPLYVVKTAALKDGTNVTGVQSDKETGGRVDLLQHGGKVVQIPHGNVIKLEISPLSLMPEGLELILTVQEFRDLIAYMEILR